MKIKLLLAAFSIVFFLANMAFAQESNEVTYAHPCYKQLLITVKNYGYLKSNGAYGWGVKIKNNYKTAVSFTYKLTVGDEKVQGGQPTYSIDPGKTWALDWGRLALLLKNSSSHEFRVEIWGLCFKGSDCSGDNYFDCDGKQIKDKLFGVNRKTNGNSQDSQNSAPIGSKSSLKTVDDQINENLEIKAKLCLELSKVNTQSSLCNKTPANYMTGLSGTDSQNNIRKQTILSEIGTDIRELESLLRQTSGKQTPVEKRQTGTENQQEKFNSLITQGDNAVSSRTYDSAMSYYSQAQNAAVNDAQKNTAEQKYNQAYEAKRNAARGQRVEESNKRDNTEDAAYATAAGATLGAMSLLKDGYTHRGFSGKFQAGLGYDQTPMITNQNNVDAALASYADEVSYPTVDFGLRLEILNNKPVNINLRGLYSVGLHAFETGVSGTHVVTGVDGGIQFWYKTATKFKLFADFGWYQRTGERTRDEDAVNEGTSATDDVREGKYNYDLIRLGFGPMLHFRDAGKETWIRPGVYFDKVSFAKENKSALSYSLNFNIQSAIIIEASYSKSYPIGGTVNYPDAFTTGNKDYFSIRIIRQGKLW